MPDTQQKSLAESATELMDMARRYARQETVEPLRGIGRYLGFGMAGGLLVGIGVVLLMLSGLRALQTETGTTFHGSWSWAPYLIVLVVGAAVVALAISRISRK